MKTSHLKLITTFSLSGISALAVMALGSTASLGEGNYPTEVATMEFGHGIRLTDTQGMTLYQLENDLREPGTSTCVDDCAVKHPPLLASKIPAQIPDNWGLIEREDGTQQWAFEGMPLYSYTLDSHVGADYGQGQGWKVAFQTINTPSELSVSSTVQGYVLASSSGQTLYFRDESKDTKSDECIGDCLETWLPAKAPWAASDYGDFSVHARPDGVYQWAYKGKPLFLYSGDSESGDLNGDGIDGVWTTMILEPPPPVPEWVKVVGSDGGPLYANSNGMTLYTLYVDNNARITTYLGGNQCDEACLDKYWTPVTAQSKEQPVGHWSVIERDDQTLQWAYMSRPLYTLDLETRSGQLFYTTFRQFQWMKPVMYAMPALQGVFF